MLRYNFLEIYVNYLIDDETKSFFMQLLRILETKNLLKTFLRKSSQFTITKLESSIIWKETMHRKHINVLLYVAKMSAVGASCEWWSSPCEGHTNYLVWSRLVARILVRIRAYKKQMKASLHFSHLLGGAAIDNTGTVPRAIQTRYMYLRKMTPKINWR